MTLRDVAAYLDAQQLTKSFFPERLESAPELPCTPSGKIQKFNLRELAKDCTANTLSAPAQCRFFGFIREIRHHLGRSCNNLRLT